VPVAQRSSCLAANVVITYVGAMAAPLLSAPLANTRGIPIVLIACGLIRLSGALMFRLLPVTPAQTSNGMRHASDDV
jgi:hypothetical protein